MANTSACPLGTPIPSPFPGCCTVEVLVGYNVADEKREDCVVVDSSLHRSGSSMNFLYGKTGSVSVHRNHFGHVESRSPSTLLFFTY
jgi:hypothetical protein